MLSFIFLLGFPVSGFSINKGEKNYYPHMPPREFTQALNPERTPTSTWLVCFAFLPIVLCSGQLVTT